MTHMFWRSQNCFFHESKDFFEPNQNFGGFTPGGPTYLAYLDQARKIVYHKLLESTTTKGLWKGAVKSLADKTSGSVE